MTKQKTSKTTNSKIQSGHRKAGQVKASKTSRKGISKSSDTSSTCTAQIPMLSHEQITERAKKIWQDRGCVPGFDEQNWHEAERQLKTQLEL